MCQVLAGKWGIFYLRLHILEKEKNVGDNWREVAARERPTEAPDTFCSWLQTSPEVRLHFWFLGSMRSLHLENEKCYQKVLKLVVVPANLRILTKVLNDVITHNKIGPYF